MKFLFLITFYLVQFSVEGQISSVEGKVLDLNTKQPLKGAEVLLINNLGAKLKDSVEFFWRKIYSTNGTLITEPSKTKIVTKPSLTDEDGFFIFKDVDHLTKLSACTK